MNYDFIVLDYPASKPNEYAQIPTTSTVDTPEIQPTVLGGPILLKSMVFHLNNATLIFFYMSLMNIYIKILQI